MAKKYIFVRMPEEDYKIAKGIQTNMQNDLKKLTGKNITLPMTKVFRAIINPQFNKNWIEINNHDLIKLAKEKKR